MTNTMDLNSGLIGRFWIQGRPRTKGSMKCLAGKGQPHRMVEDHKHSTPWKNHMAREIRRMILANRGIGYETVDRVTDDGRTINGWVPYDGPVDVRATFFFERQIGADGNIIPSHRTLFPTDTHIGDVDKLIRNLLDAMQLSQLISDDKNVSQLIVDKRWAARGNPGGVQACVMVYPAHVYEPDTDTREYVDPILDWMDYR